MGGVVPDVATDSEDRVYVTRREPPGILVYDSEGRYLSTLAEDILTNPHNIWIDPKNHLYVADTGNHRISSTRYVDGVREGEATGFDASGQKTWETNYRNNLLEGDFIEYHPNGKRSTRSPYKNGILLGVAEGWFPSGTKSWVAEWNGKKPMGTHQNWHPKSHTG